MNILKKNIAANLGGGIWASLMSLIFLPLYIHFLGIEAYGLIGIFASLLAIFNILDMGLGATLNREMARLVVQSGKAQEMGDLVRTLEIPYWLTGLSISAIIALISPFIAYHWVTAQNLNPNTIQTAIMIMGLAIAAQWPLSLYSGGLSGLQRQVLLNSINAIMAALRGIGAILILWRISPTIEAYFLWQIVVSILHVGLLSFFLRQNLPFHSLKPRFRRELLNSNWHFAAGMMGISVLSAILTQQDKVILSRMLNLEMFGYYSLASAVASNLWVFIRPVFEATYPRFTNLVTLNAKEELTQLYHNSAQLLSVLVLPAAFVLMFFSKEILLLWTQNSVTAEHTYLFVSILVVGTAFNGIMNVPYALQLAFGWTRLSIFLNLILVAFLIPLMILFTKWYGAIGAASVWVILNACSIILGIHIMHRRLIIAEKWRWYSKDVGLPLGVSLIVAAILRFTIPLPVNQVVLAVFIIVFSFIILGATFISTPVTRNWALEQFLAWRLHVNNISRR
jgi:O-antigen/teichoic acid export membrane protein